MVDILEQEESEEDDQEILLFLLWRRWKPLRASHRIMWTKRWILRRKQQRVYENIIRELNDEDPEKFRQYQT